MHVEITEIHFHTFAAKIVIAFCSTFPHTVWKLRKITLTHFWQKFRESNGFTKEITK